MVLGHEPFLELDEYLNLFLGKKKWNVFPFPFPPPSPLSILFQILFPFRLLQNIEQSSLCYTVGPYWLFILNRAVCICQPQT